LLIVPIVVLTLLDIASYVIARTLGIIDDVKASTSDKETVHATSDAPAIRVYEAATPPSLSSSSSSIVTESGRQSLLNSADHAQHNRLRRPPDLNAESFTGAHASENGSLPQAYFTEENSMKLAGVGVFSPAVSRPPSPTMTRKQLNSDLGVGESLRKRK